ncbi:DUF748 domain-containing protein [Psychrilyobacter atlanticus]|uniref:DUF748 domain-containing protein n=1 Tax=Psychrilyobacter atlanticus TaxID=271091 RepID=UPI00041DFA76|nr:DUF748 domain-containing protein [Psychrilyobacter atlanticus]
MKKKIYIGLFIGWIIFMIQLPSIVKNIAVNKLEKTIGRKVSSGDFRYNYLRNILSIENLKIYEDDGENIFVKFDSFNVNIDILPLLKRKFYIEELTLINPNFTLKYSDGTANFDSILKKIGSDNKKVEDATETNHYIKSVELENITIDNFTFYYNDQVVQGKNKFTLETPQLLYENKNIILNSIVDFYESGEINLNLEYKKDGSLSGEIKTKDFLLDDKLYIVKALYGLEKLEGEIDSCFNFNFNFLKEIYNLKGQFSLKDLKVSSDKFGKLFSIGSVEGEIEDFKIKENKFFLKDIRTNKGVVDIENIKKYMSLISKISKEKENESSVKRDELEYPIFNIKRFEISDYKIYDEKVNLEIENFKINDLGTLKGNSNFEFAGKFQNSEVNFTGEIKKEKAVRKEEDLNYIGIGGNINILSLNLKNIDPLLQEKLNLNGSLDISSKFNYLTNNLQMENLISLKKLSLKKDDMVLKVENLKFNNTISKNSKDYHIRGKIKAQGGAFNMDEVNFWLKSGEIEIGEISKNKIRLNKIKLERPWIKIKKKEEKNNIQEKITQRESSKGHEKNNLKEEEIGKVKLPELFIKNIGVSNGRLDYINKDIKYNLRDITVDIDSFTTEKNKEFNGDIRADLTGNGKFKFNFLSSLEKSWDFSPVSLNMDGELDIYNLNFLDFKQVLSENLPNEIDNGKLNYNCNISLNKGKVVGENLISVEKINIGEATKVNSMIPLKLGVNILKDREDNLKLDLPISGDFNNPKFKISKVVLEALKNILIRAVASPADFILNSFNIGDEKDLFIEYDYLNPNFKNKDNNTLGKVVEILEKKEDINIIFTLFTDKEVEKNLLNTQLKEEMFFKRDTKDEILEEKINKIITERSEGIKNYFKGKELGERVKVQISDISRNKAMSSIELIIKD